MQIVMWNGFASDTSSNPRPTWWSGCSQYRATEKWGEIERALNPLFIWSSSSSADMYCIPFFCGAALRGRTTLTGGQAQISHQIRLEVNHP